MPILFVVVFIFLGLIIPKFMKYFVIAPIISFTVGTFFLALFGSLGYVDLTWNTFFMWELVSLLLVEFWMIFIEKP